jgi:N utilization substance protein B
MQAIYEYSVSEHRSANSAKKNLMRSFDDMYMLYIRILALFGALTHISEQVIELKKQKYLATTTDLHPSLNFINNVFIQKLEQNTDLQRYIRENNLMWNNEADLSFVRKIYDAMCHKDFFIEYMQNHTNSFQADKQVVLSILEKFMLENEDMILYFGEIKISWLHDFNDVIILIHNTLKLFTQKQSDDKPLPPLFKISEDNYSEELHFAQNLLTKTIQNDRQYEQIITERIQNWEVDRVAYVDFILIKMAMCEFCEFPSIPLRVTLNEYIEISKYYSTPKSKIFINGLLDNILSYLKEENKIHKQGRGLMG